MISTVSCENVDLADSDGATADLDALATVVDAGCVASTESKSPPEILLVLILIALLASAAYILL